MLSQRSILLPKWGRCGCREGMVASGPQDRGCVSSGAFLEIALDLTSKPLISAGYGLSCPAVCVVCASCCCCFWIFLLCAIRTSFLQARILDWVAVPFSRGSSQPRDWTQVSRIAGSFFTIWGTREGNPLAKSVGVPCSICETFLGAYNRAWNQQWGPSEHRVLLKFFIMPTLQSNSRLTRLANRPCEVLRRSEGRKSWRGEGRFFFNGEGKSKDAYSWVLFLTHALLLNSCLFNLLMVAASLRLSTNIPIICFLSHFAEVSILLLRWLLFPCCGNKRFLKPLQERVLSFWIPTGHELSFFVHPGMYAYMCIYLL